MAITRPTIVGVFENTSMADKAIHALEERGLKSEQIYYSGRQGTSGGFMAGLKSLFTGEDTTDNAGNVTDDLAGMGFSNEEANYYANEYQAGRPLVAVKADGYEQDVAQILQTNGAHTYGRQQGASTRTGYATDAAADTNRYRTNRGAEGAVSQTDYMDSTTADTDAYRTNRTSERTSDEAHKLRLREEQLEVDKQRVQAGEVRLHKDIVSEEKTIDVPVTHEEAYIERRPVTDATIDNETPIGEEETIRVPLSQEQVNVRKNTVTTGEVAVGKRSVEETQRVSDTVRKEKARIEQQGNAPLADGERLQEEDL